jgi:hypothetical protein
MSTKTTYETDNTDEVEITSETDGGSGGARAGQGRFIRQCGLSLPIAF